MNIFLFGNKLISIIAVQIVENKSIKLLCWNRIVYGIFNIFTNKENIKSLQMKHLIKYK